jgi:hypothetical protein
LQDIFIYLNVFRKYPKEKNLFKLASNARSPRLGQGKRGESYRQFIASGNEVSGMQEHAFIAFV